MYRDFIPEDLTAIANPAEPFATDCIGPELIGRVIGITRVENDKVMACGGVYFTDAVTATVWMRIDIACFEQPIKWARIILGIFKGIERSIKDGVQLETYVAEGFERGVKLIDKLGFKATGETLTMNDRLFNRYVI